MLEGAAQGGPAAGPKGSPCSCIIWAARNARQSLVARQATRGPRRDLERAGPLWAPLLGAAAARIAVPNMFSSDAGLGARQISAQRARSHMVAPHLRRRIGAAHVRPCAHRHVICIQKTVVRHKSSGQEM